jgi:hypothetical protein
MRTQSGGLKGSYLPDVADLVVVEINFKDDWQLAESGFGQFGDFVALFGEQEKRKKFEANVHGVKNFLALTSR